METDLQNARGPQMEQAEPGADVAAATGTGQNSGATLCDAGYDQSVELFEAVRAHAPPGAMTETLPSRAAYEIECLRLSPAAQQCQVLSYALDHDEECQLIMETPEVQAFEEAFRRLMNP